MSASHDVLGGISYDILPGWEKTLWARQKYRIPNFCFYPDEHLCQQADHEKEKLFRKYCILPNGHIVPHGPCDDDYTLCIFSNYHSRKVRKYVICYYYKRLVELLRVGDFEESAKYGGVFAHYLQDACCPGHVINNFLLNRLFPPVNGQYWHYHRLIDAWPCEGQSITSKPILLGVSVDEAVFNLCAEYDKAVSLAQSKLCPFVLAIQQNDQKKADMISYELNSRAVRLCASAWHTAFCAAFGKYVRAEAASLREVCLSDMVPINETGEKHQRDNLEKHGIKFHKTKYRDADPLRSRISSDPYPFEPVPNLSFDGNGKTIPLALNIYKGKKAVKKTFQRGIASGGCAMLVFEVPGKIYGWLHVMAGIHPVTEKGKSASFAVFCDQSGEKAFLGGKISNDDPPVMFKIPLKPDCKTISLIVTEGLPGTHAVWAEPTLTKRNK